MGGLLSVPAAMAYAAIIFAPFGPEYLPMGVASCVTALFVVNVLSAFFRGPAVLLSSVYSLSAVVMASMGSQILAHQEAQGQTRPLEAIALLLLAAGLSGLLQVGMGLAGIGRLTKYVPLPVISGLRTGAALTIVATQIPPLLGLPRGTALHDLAVGDVRWPFLCTGLITFLVMTLSGRLSARIPAGIAAIGIGSALYFAFAAAGVLDGAQGLVGAVPLSIPAPSYLTDFAALLADPDTRTLLWKLVPAVSSLALLNTMQTLIGAVTADSLVQTRSSADRELVGQGVANAASSLFGGVPLSGLISITVANHRSGGRTHLSRVTSGLFALAVLLALGPLLAWLPAIVLAGLLLGLSLMLADLDTLRGFVAVFRSRGLHRKDLQDIAVLSLVMLTMFALGPIEGVLLGAAASVGVFVKNMTMTNIHREYRADWIRSNVQRGASEYDLLVEHGGGIVVVEVMGPLFFGTSDRLASHVDELIEDGPRTVILDFARVFDIDRTASTLLLQAVQRAERKGVRVIVSGLATNPRLHAFVSSQPLLEKLSARQHHDTLDDALAAAEDDLIEAVGPSTGAQSLLAPRELSGLAPMSDGAVLLLAEILTLTRFDEGDVICRQGSYPDELFFLAQGRLQVAVSDHEDLDKGIGVLCAGSIFGEMSFIDDTPRSASVVALEPSACYVLARSDLMALQESHPEVSQGLYSAMLATLARRVRILNRARAVFREL